MITDKEVGKLWRRLNEDCGRKFECPNHGNEFRLIRKLVEERRVKLRVICKLEFNGYCPHDDNYHANESVDDFGINPDSFSSAAVDSRIGAAEEKNG